MPKTIFLGNESNGISVTWTPSASRLDISGYFDDFGSEMDEKFLEFAFKMAQKHRNFFEEYKHIILTFELNVGHFRRCWYT